MFGYVLGEHGKTSFIPWSITNIGGLSFDAWCDMTGADRLVQDEILTAVMQAGFEIFQRKQNTNHGIAASLYRIVQAILFNEGSILPVGVYLQGEYGIEDCVLSVPVLVDARGIGQILNYPLTAEEQAKLHHSARYLQALASTVSAQTGLQ